MSPSRRKPKARPGARTDNELPISPLEPAAYQARISLMLGQELDVALGMVEKMPLVTFRYSTDLRQEDQVARLRAELGDDAVLPDDGGIHYLFLIDRGGKKPEPYLQAEAEVPATVFGMAAVFGMADRVQYRVGQIPR